MIILFLDIDGVIFYNPFDGRVHKRVDELMKGREHEFTKPYPAIEFDRAAVDLFDASSLHYLDKLIQDIAKETGKEVGIVISSNWRIGYTFPVLQDLFKQHSFSNYLIDQTPELFARPRAVEIEKWLFDNQERYNVSGVVILDDDDSGLSRKFPEHFVEFHHRTLFRVEEYEKALAAALKPFKKISQLSPEKEDYDYASLR